MRVRLAVSLFVLVAGCLGAPQPSGDIAAIRDASDCHETEPSPSANAPLAPGFLGTPEEVLARLAAHVGANVTGELVEVEPGRWTLWTDNGQLRLERVAGHELFGPETYLSWTGNRSWAPSEAEAIAWIERLARAFEADPSSLTIAGHDETGAGHIGFAQSVDGKRLGGTGGSLRLAPASTRPTLDLHGLRDLPNAPLALSEAEAREIALLHARCVMDENGRTAGEGFATEGVEGSEQIAVHGDSLVRGIVVRFAEPGEPSHCGMPILVRIDATTGDVLAAGRPPCD